ncbi:MAG: galactokinase [Acidobacteria bacterium]|nr:galactokinase [Acidobacteriota bacterium]
MQNAQRFDRAEVVRTLHTRYENVYGGAATVYGAPGRVNLIGEHTDYNDGFVMPAAIDMWTYAAVGPRPDRLLRVYSENFQASVDIALGKIAPGKTGHWSDYVRGVAGVLEAHGHTLRGANLVIQGNVPLGSGLSSSAAIEVATAFALLGNSGLQVDRTSIARMCQQAENEYTGTPCGIMDQFVSCHGKEGHGLMLDCRSLDYHLFPLPPAVCLLICNTMVKHELANSEYAARRRECQEGVRILGGVLPGIRALRDVGLEDLERYKGLLTPVVFKRCRHVISENGRVQEAAAALQRADIDGFGRFMAESHRSLREDYEVSCRELDIMVNIAQEQPEIHGARMTGGGFGGCTINLVEAATAEEVRQRIALGYEAETGIKPETYLCRASQGAEQATH